MARKRTTKKQPAKKRAPKKPFREIVDDGDRRYVELTDAETMKYKLANAEVELADQKIVSATEELCKVRLEWREADRERQTGILRLRSVKAAKSNTLDKLLDGIATAAGGQKFAAIDETRQRLYIE